MTVPPPAITVTSLVRAAPRPRRVALAALAALVALLAGCSTFNRASPVKETYLLEPAMPPVAARTSPLSVRVAGVNVAAPYRGRNFVYRTQALRYETDYYVEFLVAPSAMFTELTARALEASHVFARVVPPGSGGDADVSLEGFVSALYADVKDGASPVSAELAVTYYLTSYSTGSTPSWTKEYRRHVDLTTRTPAAYVAAQNVAFGEILAELARDLAALDLKR
jgi:ABC-type uncharacterized transport system auxiliary subunit